MSLGAFYLKGLYGGAYFQNFTVLYFRSVLLTDSSALRVICNKRASSLVEEEQLMVLSQQNLHFR